MKSEFLDWASWTLKFMGSLIIVVMVLWLLVSNVQPNFVQGRIIMGLLMMILGYLIDIKRLLAGPPVGK